MYRTLSQAQRSGSKASSAHVELRLSFPGALYPMLKPERSGLTKIPYALIDQLRSVDRRRIRRLVSVVSTSAFDALDESLVLFLGLGAKLMSSEAD